MDDAKLEVQIEVIKVKVENMSDQMKRFISHVESERDVRVEQGKRIDQCERNIEYIKHQKEENEKKGRWKIETLITLAALGISLATLLIMMAK